MNANLRLQIANRIHLMLLRELGQGIEVARLLRDALYARDVLLVCDASQGTPLPALASQFRATEPEAQIRAPQPYRPPVSALPPHGTLSRRKSSPPSET